MGKYNKLVRYRYRKSSEHVAEFISMLGAKVIAVNWDCGDYVEVTYLIDVYDKE